MGYDACPSRHLLIKSIGVRFCGSTSAAQRAQKQYDAADPENRLVADELERRWNDALLRVEEVESRIE
ncbi:hypothetical protein V4C53_47795, partial [Paraburkholderia azotifigens]